jgi:hypothetical protein
MKNNSMKSILRAILSFGVLTAAANAERLPSQPSYDAAQIRSAVEKGIALLQPTGPTFFLKSGCVSCHHQALPAMATSLAHQRGFAYDAKIQEQQNNAILAVLKPAREVALENSDVVPQLPASGGYLLMALSAQGHAPDDTTAAVVHAIAMRQRQDGAWTGWAARQPISGRDIRETAIAAHALDLYSPKGRRAEMDERIARARRFLLNTKAQTSEENIFRLMGLTWTKASPAEIRAAAKEVLAAQRPDGGWAQLKSLGSDAWATGEALVALHNAGALETSSLAYQKGVQYLLSTQESDGSWWVKTRAFPYQPLIDTGYPHGRDQWSSAAGSSWALMALMLTAEPVGERPLAHATGSSTGKPVSYQIR